MLLVPVSNGEIYDKITILEIKLTKFPAGTKRDNVATELKALNEVEALIPNRQDCADLVARLLAINSELWDIEEGKRDHERRQDFGPSFIELARQVYLKNDLRAAIKRKINEVTGSAIMEEKSHTLKLD